ncbi:MAG TPA: Lrp/AsnC family transcriptional regulator [Burkholderiaceae bacterium]|nr:Lrp/AsnC family transcriptional regulator [Burkholderiaceae bacterium]
MPEIKLDRTDCRILNELQHNGRLNNQDLADRVSLSPSPCLRRVRRLEEEGYIRQYVALVDSEKIGRGLLAYVAIRLNKSLRASHAPMSDFARDVQAWPEVVECYAMSGDMDYLLRIQVEDLTRFSRFAMDKLIQHPAVIDMRSSFMMQRIKETTELPIEVLAGQ